MEKKIKSALFELGIPCILRETTHSPNCDTFHFDLCDIKQLEQAKKSVKFLSAYLHIDITFKSSEKAHFALSTPIQNELVKFTNEKYSYIFNEDVNMVFAGVDDNNEPIFFEMSDVPHILISGMSGSGKSITLHSIICSLMKSNKLSVFYMIDTKRVELCKYKNRRLAYFDSTIEDAISTLEIICDKIDSRYEDMEMGFSYGLDTFVVIEELGDLMSYNKKLIEKYIVKIARLGRACGVHLIIATQRPTVDVVTGEIKANIGCRFALQTTSGIDSRNILGHNGAELLNGNGDCLLKLPNKQKEIHIQCPYISSEEIEQIVKENNE